jgi:Uma2 family endonuclease
VLRQHAARRRSFDVFFEARIESWNPALALKLAPLVNLDDNQLFEFCQLNRMAFDSSVGFILPNGAMRSRDASWVRRERWDALSADQRERFPPLCPDFVVELRSPPDRLSALQRRVRELIRNGAQLGWVIDPQRRAVHVFRPGEAVQSLLAPTTISAEPLLPGFVLDLAALF